MKIAILTLPIDGNYGGNLQLYALKNILEKWGHQVVIIDRKCNRISILRLCLGTIKRIFLKLLFASSYPISYKALRDREACILRYALTFSEYYLNPKTEPCRSTKDLMKKALGFDAYIVGSDQVWRPSYTPDIYNYFFDFLADNSSLRIAYAASFGHEFWELSDNQTRICKHLVASFKAVSVREDSAVQLCHEHLNIDVQHVLDPTMLLFSSEYISTFIEVTAKKRSRQLLVYILDMSQEKQEMVNKVHEFCGYECIKDKFFIVEKWRTSTVKVLSPIQEWLLGFWESEFVVTDSFHGCVFSILFNKPFVVYVNSERGTARFDSLLRLFHLENRMIHSLNELTFEQFETNIDWENVNCILEEYRMISMNFLKNSLDKK